MRNWFVLLGLMLLAIPVAASGAVTIKVAGTGDSQELLRELAGLYQQKVSGVQVEVPESIGSSGGIKAVAAGDCDLGRVARPLKDKEKALGLSYRTFAYSPVVFVVNRQAGALSGLTSQQISDIFSGKITNWKSLGGVDAEILVVNREKGDSSRSVLEKQIAGFSDLQLVGKTLTSTPDALQALVGHPHAIGYLPMAMANDPNLTVLGYNGQQPDAAAILSGIYPLVTPFGIIWKDGARPEALGFMSYLFTPDARKAIERFGVVAAID